MWQFAYPKRGLVHPVARAMNRAIRCGNICLAQAIYARNPSLDEEVLEQLHVTAYKSRDVYLKDMIRAEGYGVPEERSHGHSDVRNAANNPLRRLETTRIVTTAMSRRRPNDTRPGVEEDEPHVALDSVERAIAQFQSSAPALSRAHGFNARAWNRPLADSAHALVELASLGPKSGVFPKDREDGMPRRLDSSEKWRMTQLVRRIMHTLRQHGVVPWAATLGTILLHGAPRTFVGGTYDRQRRLRMGALAEPLHCLRELWSCGQPPESLALEITLKAAHEEGASPSAMLGLLGAVLDHGTRASPEAYVWVLKACARSGDHATARLAVEEMLSLGVPLKGAHVQTHALRDAYASVANAGRHRRRRAMASKRLGANTKNVLSWKAWKSKEPDLWRRFDFEIPWAVTRTRDERVDRPLLSAVAFFDRVAEGMAMEEGERPATSD